ncbi:scaffold prohead core protein [Sinorhizobium phage phiM7]|uniref:Scaffold prohead core protein n=2 Tax=Emdodecavirus TaxID=1980937 RepID=S5MAQ6_9CAUD|nr:head scaffolding protein [Sinorhizobium phage phiM12]YP_009601174.1 head scaffolding protein [Sinorhizobium phage phiM7]AGR47698.1 scaffold prohead core protein [Sinorhizobium phage phiM12]AKF12597.1 scaffold prohead core protein [Sinorhizobium phage phiM7]AKF12957.1 scaffold prohead core protein [Sinorhizobium phage phiM19]
MEKEDLIEAKATGEDSVAADAVTPAGGEVKKRLADKELKQPEGADNVEDDVKTPQGSNNAGLHEAVKGLFEGEEFSEEFKAKVAAVFEAAVADRVAALKEEIEAAAASKLDEEVARVEKELSETVEQFMEFTSVKWLEENAVAVEAGLKVELAESLLDGLKSLFVEHNVVVDETKVDTIQEMSTELESVSKKFTDAVKENASLQEQIVSLKNDLAFTEISEGLADTQVEKLRSLAENITFTSTEDYVSKVKAIRASFFAEAAPVVESDVTEQLTEEVAPNTGKSAGATPEMLSLAEALTRFAK